MDNRGQTARQRLKRKDYTTGPEKGMVSTQQMDTLNTWLWYRNPICGNTSVLLIFDCTQKSFTNIDCISALLWMSTQITSTELLVQRVVRIRARIIRVIRIKSFNELLNLIRIPFPRTHLTNIVMVSTKGKRD